MEKNHMLLIDTEVKPSSIHGTGLFSKEKLFKEQVIWVMHKNFDCAFTKHEWDLLPKPAKNYLQTYMYWSERLKKYVGCIDDSRHMNHSESPNTKSIYFNTLNEVPPFMRDSARMKNEQWDIIEILEGFVVTTQAIEPSEELLCNYKLDFPDFGGAGTLDFLQKGQNL
jgi:SET domain-containing protein